MDSKELRSFAEAYKAVHAPQEVDEAVYGGEPKKPEAPKDTRLVVTNADKKGNTPAYQNFKKGDKRYKAADHMGEEVVDEATAMSKRGYDEAPIRKEIASKTGGGSFADKATKLADRETYGNKKKKEGREKLARKQRGDFRNTTSSSPGLRGYGHQSSDPAVKAKQAARGAQRGSAALTPDEKKQLNREELSLDERVLGQDPEMRRARTKDDKRLPPSSGKEYATNQKKSISYMDKLTKNNKIIPGMAHESYDLFDYIMEYLITEGYADTNENALVIMANMSEQWKNSIIG